MNLNLMGILVFPIGAVGLFIGIAAALFALVVVALALAGAALFVVGALTLVGLILAAVALPFLLPFIVVLVIFWAIVAATRHTNPRKVA
jgi:hypothetical protein